ncbi:MAG: hypothetical protein ACREFU_09840 [Acetobacteraceae bacterium]
MNIERIHPGAARVANRRAIRDQIKYDSQHNGAGSRPNHRAALSSQSASVAASSIDWASLRVMIRPLRLPAPPRPLQWSSKGIR